MAFATTASVMGGDYTPYLARRGDRRRLASPAVSEKRPSLIEMPISWSLDHHPHFEFIRTHETNVSGLQWARAVMQNWHDEFLYMAETVEWGGADLHYASLRHRSRLWNAGVRRL